MTAFLHVDLFMGGWALFAGSVGCLIGVSFGHAAGYERGKRDLYADLQRRLLRDSQREKSEP